MSNNLNPISTQVFSLVARTMKYFDPKYDETLFKIFGEALMVLDSKEKTLEDFANRTVGVAFEIGNEPYKVAFQRAWEMVGVFK